MKIKTKILKVDENDPKNAFWVNHIINTDKLNGISESKDHRAIVHYGGGTFMVDMTYKELEEIWNQTKQTS